MKKTMGLCFRALTDRKLELRIRLFHVLAITGFLICVGMTGISVAGGMWISAGINFGAGIVSLALLFYSAVSRRYRLCYGITIGVIFFLLFPSLFFSGGGYRGGMPFFFVFAVVFTVYMLDGWAMAAVSGAELVFYCGLCVLAWYKPQLVVPFDSEQAVVTDIIVGLVTVGVSLGVTTSVQVRMYRSQQKKLEAAQHQAEAASQAKSAFLANMSHEIRTPIHMILGMNELIHRESHSPQVRGFSENIDQTGKMLLSLVDSVLDFSKIESGKMELLSAPYRTEDLAAALILIGKTHCSRKNLTFDVQIDPQLPEVLQGDMAHIRQIAANFLSNAAKYTVSGGVTLRMSALPGQKKEQTVLQISVEDTGIGIRQELLPRLFDAFSRGDPETRQGIEGTGLGLRISKELSDLMGGSITVSSRPGQGSTFCVRIPQQILPENPENSSAPRFFRAPEARILAVDDNEGNRSLLRQLLSAAGILPDTAASGRECLRLVSENDYDLILMDYMMPEMDGLQTMQQLRQRPEFHTPVVALTADATVETGRKLRDNGFAACLTKPVPWAKLQEVLLRLLPRERITEQSEKSPSAASCIALQKLEPYGISPGDALPYFEGSVRQYAAMAEIFLRHDGAEREKVIRFAENGDFSGLRFPIHALKGKAKNLGMGKLAELCAHMETLCSREEGEEIRSLMPFLLFLWKRGREGLEVLVGEANAGQPEPPRASAPEKDLQMLPALLRQLRRRPSLECLQRLSDALPEDRASLEEIRRLTEQFEFDRAAAALDAYLIKRKKGESQ